ncbi:MAG: tRNA guanosine(34) transglycosylase Tgt [Candidatus Binatia bacterium]
MTSRLHFRVEATATGSAARACRFRTLHGEVTTPIFMPVGTQATVKGLTVEDLESAGSHVLLANAYHLLLRPGTDVFRRFGGIHSFMNWRRSVLTDSGGYQVFSLSNDRVITEDGAVFRSYVDGARVVLSPERSIETQLAIGSDIMMAMDVCVPSTSDHEVAAAAMHRTHRWAERSLTARDNAPSALFGIVQGACFEDLRHESAAYLTRLPFDGFAIGGLAVGEGKVERERFTKLAAALLPRDLPRYLMGVGTPLDLLEAVERGVDMFDCTIPSVLARQGVAFTSTGRLNLYRGVYKLAEEAVDAECACPTCKDYSRAYVHHLIKTSEALGWQLLAKHNVHFYHHLMSRMRECIIADTFATFRDDQRLILARGDEDNPSVPTPRRRKHRNESALERFRIHESPEGHASIVHRASGEMMHGGIDPTLEANALYVEQSRLIERLREPDATNEAPFVIWDVGMGAAHNAMAAIRAYETALPAPTRPLHLVSFEHDVASLRLALRHAIKFPHLHYPAPGTVLRFGEWRSELFPIVWTLFEGDFRQHLTAAPTPDCIFWDPFSSKTDTPMWTLECLESVFAECAEHDTELFTYSAATAVRTAMLGAGFVVARGAPTGKRPETTLAMTPAAALHAAARGRTPLGPEWLEHWRRSDAKFPSDVPSTGRAALTERIESMAQFVGAPPA